MSVPALALCVDLTIDTPCAAVADRLKRLHSHVANRMRSRSSLRFVAESGMSSYERHAHLRSSCRTSTLKAHQYRHSRMYAGLLLSFVRRNRASCTSLSISSRSVPPAMSHMSSTSSSASWSSSSLLLRGMAPVIFFCEVSGACVFDVSVVMSCSVSRVEYVFCGVCVVWCVRPRRERTCRVLYGPVRRGP